MTKLLKKAITLSLCACMIVGMATAASAADVSTYGIWGVPVNTRVEIRSVMNSNERLNIYTSGSIVSNKNVTTWNTGASDGTQYWKISKYDEGKGTYIVRPYTNSALVLNLYRDSTYNCNIYAEAGNDADDYIVKIADEKPSAITNDEYGFVLPNRGRCMTMMTDEAKLQVGSESGYHVRWRAPTASSGIAAHQAWDINAV